MPHSPPPAVVITGTSSGIGEACARHLDRQGLRVFAGVRRRSDGEALRVGASERLTPLLLDVTDPTTIEAAAKQVESAQGAAGLQGLVNNAGVAVGGPLEFLEPDELRRQLEVNLVGPVAVTRTFLPSIRAGAGRVVNIGSMGGYLALPFAGPYAASEFAMEAISDSLRRELRAWGIEVSLIEPGAIESRIWDKSISHADESLAQLPERARAFYGAMVRGMLERTRAMERKAIPPEEVARKVHHALTARRPRTRYRVGRDARVARLLSRLLPDRVLDRIVARLSGTSNAS